MKSMFEEAVTDACNCRMEETKPIWYRKEVAKLLAIVEQKDSGNISREYVAEKLKRILSGTGIGIHSSLYSNVEHILKEGYCAFCGAKLIKRKTLDRKSIYYKHHMPYCEKVQIMHLNITQGGPI